ncbi:type II toxin-antitoxin system VapC family toxin [Haloarcula nitratireducens]|uniref:Uncharacterized protein n=1 Tax=Haloarcula nitratireducens TaxID=2487749 RepID=A0AAW4PGP4_9EURY|nr:hypothetical protein [Halomicroarcula nitratireducens]MBX0296763.1 hypothetical protein [Halomicroarcula nitratireducens]
MTIIPFGSIMSLPPGRWKRTCANEELNQDKLNTLTGDLPIAAVAKDLGATVGTQNTAAFEVLDGVKVESY